MRPAPSQSIYPHTHPDRYCPWCETDFEETIFDDIAPSWYAIEVGELDKAMAYHDPHDLHAGIKACCLELNDILHRDSYEDVFGFSPKDALSALLGQRVSKAWADPINPVVVCRLSAHDPTQLNKEDTTTGLWTSKSPKGWQRFVFGHVGRHHRHHRPPQGHKFSVSVYNGYTLVGVAVVGRPVSRMVQEKEPRTLEVIRVCTWGNPALRRNAASKLYGACVKRARLLGYRKLITYTLKDIEDAASVRASGFTMDVIKSRGGTWNRTGRAREDKAPLTQKTRWSRVL